MKGKSSDSETVSLFFQENCYRLGLPMRLKYGQQTYRGRVLDPSLWLFQLDSIQEIGDFCHVRKA